MFAPTHTVPEGGLPAWAAPDPGTAPVTTLESQLPIEIAERAGDWARIVCSNGWTGWVDARQLPVATPPAPAPAPSPTPAPAAFGNETAVFAPQVANPGYAAPSPTPAPAPTYPAPTPTPAPDAGWQSAAQPKAAAPFSAGSYITIGRIVGGVGGLLVLISSWLDWFGEFGGASAHRFPVHFLLNDRSFVGRGGLSLGLIVLLLGLAALALNFIPVFNPGPGIVGIIVGFICLRFLLQLYTLVDDIGGSVEFGDTLAIGPFVAGFGALLLIASTAVDWWMRRHASAANTPSPTPDVTRSW